MHRKRPLRRTFVAGRLWETWSVKPLSCATLGHPDLKAACSGLASWATAPTPFYLALSHKQPHLFNIAAGMGFLGGKANSAYQKQRPDAFKEGIAQRPYHHVLSRLPQKVPDSQTVGIAYLFLACQVHKSRSVPSSCPAGAWPLLRMTRRCMAPAKDDTHKSERIWLKHEPYEGRSEVRCQMWGCGSGLLV